MDESNEIKACPFCSYGDLLMMVVDGSVFIKCNGCNGCGPSFQFGNFEEDNYTFREAQEMAIDRWNYRFNLSNKKASQQNFSNDMKVDSAICDYMHEKLMIRNAKTIEKFFVACDLFAYIKNQED